jgi:hypothetical protein
MAAQRAWAVGEEWGYEPARSPRPDRPLREAGGRLSVAPDASSQRRAAARRRIRLIRRRRLDLLQDSILGLSLAIFVLLVSAGLGVVALLALPVSLLLIGSLALERRGRRNAHRR